MDVLNDLNDLNDLNVLNDPNVLNGLTAFRAFRAFKTCKATTKADGEKHHHKHANIPPLPCTRLTAVSVETNP